MRTSWSFLILYLTCLERETRLDMICLLAWSMIGYLWVVGSCVWSEMSLEVRPFSFTSHFAIQTHMTWGRIGVFLHSQSHEWLKDTALFWILFSGDKYWVTSERCHLLGLNYRLPGKEGCYHFCMVSGPAHSRVIWGLQSFVSVQMET